ncbi:DNA internalization-related competence protein ComEC/Rec2 [Lysobacter solisilvae]|uniref:DNA internalization-related competence protein ComEC/Rec2 n=2 Tax=Agrilutibacter solisilvae TaxID=2763317 RepID=A0A974Y2K8_9GAMM|nr:DNA internalization-related competence protein ComEC/Rec2 [Lysobacter solisilvae]QSX80113.1 DNA internalization-related competence protein ComEC/Rec2 [Lysobacter solisilvae]
MLALLSPRLTPTWLTAPLLLTGLWLWSGARWNRRRLIRPDVSPRAIGRLAGSVTVGFALASLHAAWALSQQLPVRREKAEVHVTGHIVDLPTHEPRRTRFHFRVDASGGEPALRGRTLRLAWYDEGAPGRPDPVRVTLRGGERWSMWVRLRPPRGLRNPGSPDSEMYALAARVAATGYVRAPRLAERIAPARGLAAWREARSERIARAVPAPSSRFVRALALGDTRALSDADWIVLRANGLTHLIAISGFHVGLVAGFAALLVRLVWWVWAPLARRCPAPIAVALAAVAGAGAYAAVAGFALPTLRTVLMIAVVAGARAWRRALPAQAALALALIAVLLVDPLTVLGAGFWLSFAGVAWLLWCLPRASGRVLHDFLSAQGVATLGLLPLGVALFGQASLAGPMANLLAVPWWSLVVVPLSLLGLLVDAASADAGAASWRLAGMCFDLSWPLFEYLARSGLSLWWLPEAHGLALPLALLGAFWLLLPRGVPGKALALLLWLPLLWPDRDLPRRGEAELVVIDVGQGLSVLVRTSHHALLYDMGPSVRDGFDAGERAVVPALHALGVRRIDRAIVSHADNDHAGGYGTVAQEMPITATWAPEDSPLPPGSLRCQGGQTWDWDGVRLSFLHPPAHFPYLANESSCVLRIETAHGAALLTGDIGEVIEQRLLRAGASQLRARVVVVAHHGSNGSSDPGFIAATGAHYALVSSGHGNRFGHPRPEVVRRWRIAGAQVTSTADGGALRIGLRARGTVLETRRGAQPRLWDASRSP